MKNKIVVLICFIVISLNQNAQTYPSLNINLLSHLDPEKDNTGSDGRKYSGCWGWAQTNKNKEYAIVGTSSQTYFVDVTNPSNPVISDSVKAKKTGCTWREIKTYQNYCYMVSDDNSPNSFQIVDMQYLPDSVHIVHDGTTYFERSHTIFVDNDKLYCGSVHDVGGTNYSTMRVYSLATPTAPVLIRKLEQDVNTSIIDVVHDMYVRNDTIYASCGYKGLQILKLTASNTFSLMQSFSGYSFSGYNHSSWQTDDRKTMVFTDEVPASLPIKVVDVSDFNNLTVLKTINSHSLATPHNPYIIGNNWCWVSAYQDGLYLYDISNPANTSAYGYFDTYPEHGVNDNFSTSAYRGNWGAYPYLPSKIIIACDMQNGIFILEGDNTYKSTTGIRENKNTHSVSQFSFYPNPAKNELNFIISNQTHQTLNCLVTDVYGKLVYSEIFKVSESIYKTSLNNINLPDGCYFITLKGNTINETKKIIIQK
jgi:choice-of-anchor B domain-containing protein